MSNKISNVTYDQLPHIVINHPETDPIHWAIMKCLFRILKDKQWCIYSNEQISIDCRTSERTIRRRLSDLIKWGFIVAKGQSYSRKFSLGILFNTSATVAGSKLNTSAKLSLTLAKSASDPGHCGRHTNISTKLSTKGRNLSVAEKQNIKFYQDHPEFPIPQDMLHLLND